MSFGHVTIGREDVGRDEMLHDVVAMGDGDTVKGVCNKIFRDEEGVEL